MRISGFTDQTHFLRRPTKRIFSMAAMKVFWFITLMVVTEEAMARVFWETTDKATERFQKIPPSEETAKKMEQFLFERTSLRIVKRSIKRPEDVLIIIDSSKSVPEANFTQGMHALKSLVTKFRPNTKFAAILFSTNAKVMFKFVSPQKAMENLDRIRYNSGFTNTQAALRKAGKLLTSKRSGAREYAYKRIFILSDGQSNIKKQNTLYLAYLLKDMGVEIFVMAVGERIAGINELAMVATSTDKHLYRVGQMQEFVKVVNEIPNDPNYNSRR